MDEDPNSNIETKELNAVEKVLEPQKKEKEKQDKKKKKKAESIDEKAEVEKSIEDLVYTETYDKSMNKDYKSEEYQTFIDNMKGGNEVHNSGNFQGTK